MCVNVLWAQLSVWLGWYVSKQQFCCVLMSWKPRPAANPVIIVAWSDQCAKLDILHWCSPLMCLSCSSICLHSRLYSHNTPTHTLTQHTLPHTSTGIFCYRKGSCLQKRKSSHLPHQVCVCVCVYAHVRVCVCVTCVCVCALHVSC